ncbi:YetF domain-containing protein [Oceanobacillus rekensis]|uniref:YetF domain-containing protein n=1 Tax=Oceanobacillus rekensis TaxID=937927 RepID=UPI000B4515AC|nr:DUF421 domain-containing protein [Oceanobacillus rekensis]
MPELVLILIRSIAAFLLLLLMTRIMGKKQISQLTFFDYCVGITIGSIAATLSVDQNVKIATGLMALLVWGLFPIILAYMSLKSMWFTKMMDGTATIMIQNGKILEKNMKKNLFTIDELMLLLREKGTFKVSDVEMAVLETNGQLSVMLKTDQQPLTPHTLGIPSEPEHGPTILIMDGQLLDKGLKEHGYSKEWLLGEVQKQGAKDFKEVFLAQMDSRGNVYVDKYVDKEKQPIAEERPLLEAPLKKLQADLESLSLKTNNLEANTLSAEEKASLQKTIDLILPYLK